VLLESRALPLLVGAGISAFLGSSEMSKEEYLEKYYNNVLDWNCYLFTFNYFFYFLSQTNIPFCYSINIK
jgi:hypothetical protein